MAQVRSSTLPILFWLGDATTAVLFAGGLAVALSHAGQPRLLSIGLVMLILAAFLRGAFQIGAAMTGGQAARVAKEGWRKKVYTSILTAGASQHMMLGERISDAVERIEDIDGYHARFLPLRTAAVATPLLIAAAASAASPVSAAILLATLPPFALGMMIAGSAAGQTASRQFEALSRLSGLFVDRIRALPVIIAFGAEERIARQLGSATREVADRTIGILRVAFVSGAVIEFFAALSVALVAVYCGFSLLDLLPFHVPETLDLGRALFVLALAPEFYLPMRRLAAAYHDKQSADAATERLARLAARTDVPANTREKFSSPPSLSFEALTIDYGDHEVGPISLIVPAGLMTAITGPTGSGKSSLLHALLGLSPVASGRILIDGVPASPALLRGNVGWLGQATALIPGTLADNIRLVRPRAGQAAIEAAAMRAGLGPMIGSRPLGLATPVDHRGSGLSGGERRRIGIARVLLKDAPLWLLDEPTADLDARASTEIVALLREAGRDRTIIVTTHDQSLAMLADRQVGLP